MESQLYTRHENGDTVCRTCRHFCRIKPGERGVCGVRENRDGILVFLAFDKVIAASVDPIEKKPVFHLRPGSHSFSIATPGCNFRCDFCQNSDIAQMPNDQSGLIQGRALPPEQIVAQAVDRGCESISYTYTEPTVFFELAYETARLANEKGLLNIFVTNGYMSPDLLNAMNGLMDAANVDLKAFDPGFYKTYCGARLKPVLENLRQMKQMGVLVEITTLLIPGLNDDSDQLHSLAGFIAGDLGEETPWHISRFHPCYRMTDRPVTPAASLDKAYDAGRKAGLKYVYIGNLPGNSREHTLCHSCGTVLISRHGYQVDSRILAGPEGTGNCPECSTRIHGIFYLD